MIARISCVAFIALILSANALPQLPSNGLAVFPRTVTGSAQPPQQTGNKGGVKGSPAPNAANGEKDKKATNSSSASPKSTPPVGGNGGQEKNGGNKGGIIANNNNGGNKNGGGGNNNNNNDPQKSQCLDTRVIGKGFENDGQDVPAPGQVRSLTSSNNFINYCLTVPNLPITNGKQITTGSCNPVPIGAIPSVDNMPSSKFIFPKNFATIKAGQTFTIQMAIKNMQTGFFVNAASNYFAAPQQLNNGGQIQGHSHVVVEKLNSLDQTQPTDPKVFVFFKGLNGAAQNGKLTASVDKGLQPGVYKLSSINTSSNHQPVIAPVAQHGSLDDAVYFTVTADGKPQKRSK